MKSKDWKDVKIHDTVIIARDDLGVFKAEIIEVDIKIVEPLPTYHVDTPYGLTKDTGAVKIKYVLNDVTQEVVENLANLVAYSETAFREFTRAFNEWQAYLSTANSYKETFLTLIQTRTAE